MPDEIKQVTRLSPIAYNALEKKVAPNGIFVGGDTTQHQAGYMLGVQAVLRELRQGYLVEVA